MSKHVSLESTAEIKSAEVIKFDEYNFIKSEAGTETGKSLIEKHEDEDGREWISKNVSGALEKAVQIKEDVAASAAKDRSIKFPDGSIDRVRSIIGSDDRVDRHGDIVMQDWDLKEFTDNPVTLYGHDWYSPPIGASLRERIGKVKDSDGISRRSLKMDLFFPTAEVTEFGDSIFRLIDSGILRTFSVGFYPGEIIRVTDEKEREKLGLGEYGYILAKNRLMEISATPIPANPGAQLLACGAESGKILGNEIQIVRELYRTHYAKTGNEQGFMITDAELCSMWKRMFPNVKMSTTRSFDKCFDLTDIQVSTRTVAPPVAPPVAPAVINPPDTKDAVDNETDDADDVDIEKAIAEAVNPIMAELRALKDSIDGLQAGVDDVLQHKTEEILTPSDDGETSPGLFASGIAAL